MGDGRRTGCTHACVAGKDIGMLPLLPGPSPMAFRRPVMVAEARARQELGNWPYGS